MLVYFTSIGAYYHIVFLIFWLSSFVSDENCLRSPLGDEYNGTLDVSDDNEQCIDWLVAEEWEEYEQNRTEGMQSSKQQHKNDTDKTVNACGKNSESRYTPYIQPILQQLWC